MRYALATALLAALLTIAAAACGGGEAKPAAPVGYTGWPTYYGASQGYSAAWNDAGHYHGIEAQSQPSVSISGEGRASAPPDAAQVRVSISVRSDTAAGARDDGKKAIDALLDTLKRNGVESRDVETRSFSIRPVSERDEDSDESRIVGYQLQNTSQITFRNVDQVGKLLDELVGDVGDVLRISSITLVIEDPTDIQRQAREKAMEDAQAKAQQLAELSGVTLGPPLSISESFEGTPSGLLSKEVLVAPVEEGVAPVSVGELEAAVSVYVEYAMIVE